MLLIPTPALVAQMEHQHSESDNTWGYVADCVHYYRQGDPTTNTMMSEFTFFLLYRPFRRVSLKSLRLGEPTNSVIGREVLRHLRWMWLCGTVWDVTIPWPKEGCQGLKSW